MTHAQNVCTELFASGLVKGQGRGPRCGQSATGWPWRPLMLTLPPSLGQVAVYFGNPARTPVTECALVDTAVTRPCLRSQCLVVKTTTLCPLPGTHGVDKTLILSSTAQQHLQLPVTAFPFKLIQPQHWEKQTDASLGQHRSVFGTATGCLRMSRDVGWGQHWGVSSVHRAGVTGWAERSKFKDAVAAAGMAQ